MFICFVISVKLKYLNGSNYISVTTYVNELIQNTHSQYFSALDARKVLLGFSKV
jgi:hypothetical protein